MSGLLALLDDVAALTKLAAAQLDDITAQASRVGVKVAGVVVDDAAVTPKYVQDLPAARELPIVWQIARGSIFNKLVILLPAALLLDTFAPWLITPLLMLGGAYLCFEGAEKILHLFAPHEEGKEHAETIDAAHLEKERVAGAIKTDFILSAEIMTIALAAIEAQGVVSRGVVLALVAIGITVLVYGAVALLVKADDFGLKLAQVGRLGVTRSIGRGIVKGMPGVMTAISTIGTAAMLWVGGSIVLHGLEVFGFGALSHVIHDIAHGAGALVPAAEGAVTWIVTAALDGVFGLALGLLLVPVVTRVITPIANAFGGKKDAPAAH
jgi:uncharacterized protein